MIDKVKFKEMFAYYDKEVVAEVIDDFISEYETRLREIQAAIENGDAEMIRQTSHSFKGMTGTFMDPVPHKLSGDLETMAKGSEFTGMAETYTRLVKAADELAGELKMVRRDYVS
jgi:hypothetical protein